MPDPVRSAEQGRVGPTAYGGMLSAASAQESGAFALALSRALSAYARRQADTAYLFVPAARQALLRGLSSTGVPGEPVLEPARTPRTPAEQLPKTAPVAGEAARAASVPPAPGAEPCPRLTPTQNQVLSAENMPRPAGDNGRGVHWIPTLRSSPEVVDRFVAEAVRMGMKWVVFLNDNARIGDNDYLVKRLVENGIMPVMRVYTDGLQPIEGDLAAMVRHYVSLGVPYFQLYNEPNLLLETKGQPPDPARYVDLWLPAARQVIAGGGYPGLGALSPQGEFDDRLYLSRVLDELLRRGEGELLNHTWLAVHNYTGPRPLSDPDGFLRFRQYEAIMRAKLGRCLPMIGTEGGTHLGPGVDQRSQIEAVLGAYDHVARRLDPNFVTYTYWIIANEAGGGRDPEFAGHALIRPDGPTALALALKGHNA